MKHPRLPSYEKFGSMRLRPLVSNDARLVEHKGFNWMGGQWLYEGIGFTWFGRLEDDPQTTQGAEIAFDEVSPEVAARILEALGLPLVPGMSLAQVSSGLGEPQTTQIFAADRATYNYRAGGSETYQVSCTIHGINGLIHSSVIRSDTRRRLAVAQQVHPAF